MKKLVSLFYSAGVVLAGAGAVAAQTGSLDAGLPQGAEGPSVITVAEFAEYGVTQDSLPACAFAALVGCF